MAAKHFVVQGAQCTCQMGTTPDKLKVEGNNKEYINDGDGSTKAIASTKDIGQPFEKKTFGSCAKTQSSCAPAITEWKNFYKQVTLTNGGKVLTEESKGVCSIAGSECITFMTHGQTAAVSSEHFDNVEVPVMALLNPTANKPDKKKKDVPQIKQIKVKVENHAEKEVKSGTAKDKAATVKVRVDEQLKFEVAAYHNKAKADPAKVSWKVFNTGGFGAVAKNMAEAGPAVSLNFNEVGTYRVMAYGKDGNDITCSIDVVVAHNQLMDKFDVKTESARSDKSGYHVRRGVPVTVIAKYEMMPATAEEISRVSMVVTDASGAIIAGPTKPGVDKIVFTPSNTAATYAVYATMTPVGDGEPQKVCVDMVSEANGVTRVKNSLGAHVVRPGTSMSFSVDRMQYDHEKKDFELELVKWQLNGRDVGTGAAINLDGKAYFSTPGKYVVEAYVEKKPNAWNTKKETYGVHEGDDWQFTVQPNEIISVDVKDGSEKWTVGRKYSLEAVTLMKYDARLDGRVSWSHKGTVNGAVIADVQTNKVGPATITAGLGRSIKSLTVDASLAAINRWCFTDMDDYYKGKAGWNETLKVRIESPAAATGKVMIHILEQDSKDDFNYITELGEATFDKEGVAVLNVETNKLQTKLGELNFENYYDVFFAIQQRPGDIAFEDVKEVKSDNKLFWFPRKESNLRNRETGKFVYIHGKAEIVSVQYYDSSGYLAYKVYPYGETIKVRIQTKNMAGKELNYQLFENKRKDEDIEVKKDKLTVGADEKVEFAIDTAPMKAGKADQDMRSFYLVLQGAGRYVYPKEIKDKDAFNPKDLSFYQHIKLSDTSFELNKANSENATAVLGEALEGGMMNCKGKYCIKMGEKNKLALELNIRLAGFGRGTVPEDTFTERTAQAVSSFQRDYMGVTPSGKVCGNFLTALDEFCAKYPPTINDYKCVCGSLDKVEKKDACSGFGQGRYKGEYIGNSGEEKHHKYEYPGIHRSLLWAVSAATFYMEKKSSYRLEVVFSGYRCHADNKAHGRASTNHMGKAVDLHFLKKGVHTGSKADMNKIRSDIFIKYSGAQLNWDHPNRLSLEPDKFKVENDGAISWVHLDVRAFESKYLDDKFFVTQQKDVLGEKIVDLARTFGHSETCGCSGDQKMLEKEATCTTCDVWDKERKAFYDEFSPQAMALIQNISKANKFKFFYLVCQRRGENGFNVNPQGNNPMNIKSAGDLGKIALKTTEDYDGTGAKPTTELFGNFSTVEKGFEAYRQQLENNFPDAYAALQSDDKELADFSKGLLETGKYGKYGTLGAYREQMEGIMPGLKADYKKMLNCKLNCATYATQKEELKKDLELIDKLK